MESESIWLEKEYAVGGVTPFQFLEWKTHGLNTANIAFPTYGNKQGPGESMPLKKGKP